MVELTSNLDLVAENALLDTKELRRYVIAVACVLRIIGIDREEYREKVITHMNALITQAPGTEINLDQVYICTLQNLGYIRTISKMPGIC